eukprot:scaffold113017_cov23-Cyclotella_meneghiniana.AAC.1
MLGKFIPPYSSGAYTAVLFIFRLIPSFGRKALSTSLDIRSSCAFVNLVIENEYVTLGSTFTVSPVHASPT